MLPLESKTSGSLRLATQKEWHLWRKSGARPANVPSSPDQAYKHDGWHGWGHWLGTGNQLAKDFLPFEEALAVAQSLGLASSKEWKAWGKEGMRPSNLPSGPEQTYKHDGWQGWGHWLGTGNQHAKNFLPFIVALVVAQSLGLANNKEWTAWGKEGMRPANVPSRPDRTYKHDGWHGWGHWLGTGNQLAKDFLPFKDALLVARSIRLASNREWQAWSKSGERPANVPSKPDHVYRHTGWLGWEHWLRHGNAAPALSTTSQSASQALGSTSAGEPPPQLHPLGSPRAPPAGARAKRKACARDAGKRRMQQRH